MLAELRGLNEECGVFGIWGHDPNAAQISYYGLHALQHRGQEGAGIVVTDGESLQAVKGEGLVNEVFQCRKARSFARQWLRLDMYVMQLQVAAELKMFNLFIPFDNWQSCDCT